MEELDLEKVFWEFASDKALELPSKNNYNLKNDTLFISCMLSLNIMPTLGIKKGDQFRTDRINEVAEKIIRVVNKASNNEMVNGIIRGQDEKKLRVVKLEPRANSTESYAVVIYLESELSVEDFHKWLDESMRTEGVVDIGRGQLPYNIKKT